MGEESKYTIGRGLDVGTSYIIQAKELKDGRVQYTEFRDAFYRLKPATPIAKKIMERGLKGQHYFIDQDSFVVLGQDAIERAIERHESAARPLERGVISPKEKEARRVLRYILKEVIGSPAEENEKIVYSVPAQPVDQAEDAFDVGFHIDAINNDLKSLGFDPQPLHEAEAICYSELEDEDYSGLAVSAGAGMMNICLMSAGEGLLRFATCKSGDFIDRMAAIASAEPDTVVQQEKENTPFVIGKESNSRILNAVSSYYIRVIDYTVQHIVNFISRATNLPKFTSPIPIILAGGTSQANGFVETFQASIEKYKDSFPFEVKEVRAAKDKLRSVSRGLLLASQL